MITGLAFASFAIIVAMSLSGGSALAPSEAAAQDNGPSPGGGGGGGGTGGGGGSCDPRCLPPHCASGHPAGYPGMDGVCPAADRCSGKSGCQYVITHYNDGHSSYECRTVGDCSTTGGGHPAIVY